MTAKLDETTQAAMEKQLGLELLKNERIVEHPELGKILLKRAHLEDDAKIGEHRRKSYQNDMRNPDVMSRAELEAIAVRRGMWDPTIPKQITELMTDTGRAMSVLEGTGFKTAEEMLADLQTKGEALKAEFPHSEPLDLQIKAAIDRIVTDLDMNQADLKLIDDNALSSTCWELVEEIKLIRDQLKILERFVEQRQELNKLQVKQVELFVDSIESRAEREQELATLYYCCLNADTRKPLWPMIEDMKRVDQSLVGFLMTEYSYFINGITVEMQDMLAKYGFLQRLSDTTSGSDDTPVQPESKLDGVTPDNPQIDSSPALALV